jgi:hypothetical protein
MKKTQLTYEEIELLQFISKNAIDGLPGVMVTDALVTKLDMLQLKLIMMRAEMEYAKRD